MIVKPNLCKKEKGNTKIFNLKTMKNLHHKIFLKFFEKFFRFQIAFCVDLKRKKIFQKISKNFFDIRKLFWKKLICKKTPSLSQKLMIYHKIPISGVYENVFETSQISILLSLRGELLITICVRIPCICMYYNYRSLGLCVFGFKIPINIKK